MALPVSDNLAVEKLFDERNERHLQHLDQFFADARLPYDLNSSLSIARWAYAQTADAGGLVWVQEKVLRHLGSEWPKLLTVA